MKGCKILIIEDDLELADAVRLQLECRGFRVDVAAEGDAALEAAGRQQYSLILLDLNLPGLDGLELCRRLRSSDETLPIIIISTLGCEVDKVSGLASGANDYLAKPFSIPELIARVRAQLRTLDAVRRSARSEEGPKALKFGPLFIDSERRIVTVHDTEVDLTPKEFLLLQYLALRPGRAVSRDSLMLHVWEYSSPSYSEVVTIAVSRLRNKLSAEEPEHDFIHTVRGFGYRFDPPAHSSSNLLCAVG